jgi:hypothetical protein
MTACVMGVMGHEGIVSKRPGSIYRSPLERPKNADAPAVQHEVRLPAEGYPSSPPPHARNR